MRHARSFLTFTGAALICLAAVGPLAACPMCKLATETTNRQPQAYMYSILFMMGMPAAITTGFGIGFYRLSRKAARMQAEAAAQFAADASEVPNATADPLAPPARSFDADSGNRGEQAAGGFAFP